jgi:flagellar hook-basal body complex protein FliE
MPINSIDGIKGFTPISFDKTDLLSEETQGLDFSKFLNDAINKVNEIQLDSTELTNEFAAGKTDNIHEVLIAGEKADVALQLTMQIRNKILDAYNEIMRMQI